MLQKHLSSGVEVNAVTPLVCRDSSGTAFISQIPCRIPLLQEKDLSSGVVHQDAAPITLPLAVFQVLVTYSGQECTGLAEQHNPPSDKVKVLLGSTHQGSCSQQQQALRLYVIQFGAYLCATARSRLQPGKCTYLLLNKPAQIVIRLKTHIVGLYVKSTLTARLSSSCSSKVRPHHLTAQ